MGVWGNVCRLCGEKLDLLTSINVFESESKHQVLAMINQFIPITISEGDPYPKSVCINCVTTLDAVRKLREKSLSVALAFSETLSADDRKVFGTDGNVLMHVKIEPSYEIEVQEGAEEEEPESECHFDAERFPETAVQDRLITHIKEEQMTYFENPSILTVGKSEYFKEKPFGCQFCSKTYCEKSSLKKHQLIHTSETTFKCPDCERSFHHRSSLTSHQKTHQDKKTFFCVHCNKCYFDKSTLNKHLRIHTGLKPFQCQHCDKSFSVRAIMMIHQRTHFAEKNYQCDQCDKCFSEKSYLNKHRSVHTGEKPFQCQDCGKSFRLRVSLISHERTHIPKTKHEPAPPPAPEPAPLICKSEFEPISDESNLVSRDVG